MAKVKVALVFGGGAARGLAHLGVLNVLERAQIPIDMVVGTSMGALVGAMYATHGRVDSFLTKSVDYLHSTEFAESKIHSLRQGEGEGEEQGFFNQVSKVVRRAQVVSSTMTRRSYFSPEEVREFFAHFVDDRDIAKLKLPFCALATDLLTGEQVEIDSGSVIQATMASSAIPGAFPPVKIGERTCIDGGMVNMVPATVALKRGADFVIAINVSHELPKPPEIKRALEIYFRAHEITKRMLIDHQIKFADVVITPHVGAIHWADFTKTDELIEAGEKAAEEKLPAIWALLQRMRRIPRFMRSKKVRRDDLIP
jgi:NTE family protein